MAEFKVMMHGAGKMGTAAAEVISAQEDMEIVVVYDKIRENADKLAAEFNALSLKMPDALSPITKDIRGEEDCGVIVDFTSEDGCRELFKQFEMEPGTKPLIVTGTTPLSEEAKEYTQNVAKGNGIVAVRAPNFSVGVNRFFYDMENIAELSDDDYISIHEIHRQEKASTSGTARDIAKGLCQMFGRKGYVTLFPSPQFYNPDGSEVILPMHIKTSLNTKNLAVDFKKLLSPYLKDSHWIKISAERRADEPGTHIVTIGDEKSYRQYTVRAEREDYGEGVVMSIRASPRLGRGIHDFKSDVLGL